MKQKTLLFNFFLLSTLLINLFGADANCEEPAPKRQRVEYPFVFKVDYFTQEERRKAQSICYDNHIEYPESGANQTSPDPAIKCIKIYRQETFIGFMVFKEEFEDPIWTEIHISHLLIDTAYQQQGLGTHCMNFLFNLYPTITAFKLNAKEEAIPFYEKFGFKKDNFSADNLMIKE